MGVWKGIIKALAILIAVIVAVALLGVGYLSLTEYRPEAVAPLAAPQGGANSPKVGEAFTILSLNTGYAGLDASADFFMDGGRSVQPETRQQVETNLQSLARLLQQHPADAYFLQEVDRNSKRSFGMDQAAFYEQALGLEGVFAYNYHCKFVPFPWPPIGRVESGLLTLTSAPCAQASRIQLPNPFSWPVRLANLKRCLLVTRIPVAHSSRELVLINLHLEAYDDGEGKLLQTQMLCELLEQEYAAGNYVIAGGDFNQTFPGSLERYPILNQAHWVPGALSQADLPAGFSFGVDHSAPTCRLLNAPYDPAASQVYVIDGYILSPNLRLEQVTTIETGFAHSDHQPILLQATLLP